MINANGQLGIQTSSARFKQDIQDIGDESDKLLDLHPVSFRYRADVVPDPAERQYGLIAEEVDKIFPELVIHDEQGQPYALQYNELPALLLNEIQKQQRFIDSQQELIRELSARLSAVEHAVRSSAGK